jgi:uncharacterized damage-inducible protein DinB
MDASIILDKIIFQPEWSRKLNENYLVSIFEHNNWANQQIIEACYALSNEQLDAKPESATVGSIRETLMHFVRSQQGYLGILTVPVEERESISIDFDELKESALKSGEDLLAIARGERKPLQASLRTKNGYSVEPWVVMVQIINHATEHREQIKSMLTDLGIKPPEIDGWDFGEYSNALIPRSAN